VRSRSVKLYGQISAEAPQTLYGLSIALVAITGVLVSLASYPNMGFHGRAVGIVTATCCPDARAASEPTC